MGFQNRNFSGPAGNMGGNMGGYGGQGQMGNFGGGPMGSMNNFGGGGGFNRGGMMGGMRGGMNNRGRGGMGMNNMGGGMNMPMGGNMMGMGGGMGMMGGNMGMMGGMGRLKSPTLHPYLYSLMLQRYPDANVVLQEDLEDLAATNLTSILPSSVKTKVEVAATATGIPTVPSDLDRSKRALRQNHISCWSFATGTGATSFLFQLNRFRVLPLLFSRNLC